MTTFATSRFAMSRKLHNTISALMFSGSVLVLGLVAASPGVRPDPGSAPQPQAVVLETAAQQRVLLAAHAAADAAHADALAWQNQSGADSVEALADAAALTAELATATALAAALEEISAAQPAAAEKPRNKAGKPSRIRQSMAMPYFSFASRG